MPNSSAPAAPDELFRVMHSFGLRSVCLWVEVYAATRRMLVRLEELAEDVSASHFAATVARIEERAGWKCRGYCDKELYEPGGPANAWKANGLHCREVDVGSEPNWTLLTEYSSPVKVLLPNGTWEETPRLLCHHEASTAKRVLDLAAFGEHGVADADGLMAHALLVACLSRPPRFTEQLQPKEQDEEYYVRRWAKHFPKPKVEKNERRRALY